MAGVKEQANYTSVQPGGPAVLVGLQLTLSVQPEEYLYANSMSVGFRVSTFHIVSFSSHPFLWSMLAKFL